MNQEYTKMFSGKLNNGMYMFDFNNTLHDYEADLKKLG